MAVVLDKVHVTNSVRRELKRGEPIVRNFGGGYTKRQRIILNGEVNAQTLNRITRLATARGYRFVGEG